MENIKIRLPKMILILTEHELLKALAAAPDVFRKAIGRGKAEQRATDNSRRQAKGFDRWALYEALKGNRFDSQTIKWVFGMNAEECKFGVVEFLEYRMRENRS